MQNNQTIKMEFPEKRNYWTFIFFIPIIILLSACYIFLIYKFSFKGIQNILSPVAILAYLVFIIRAFLWNIKGYEKVEIDNENLSILKKGTFLTRKKVYNLRHIKIIRYEPKEYKFFEFLASRSGLTGLNSFGPITFYYDNQTYNFGGNVDITEANEIVNLLKSKTNKV